MADPTEATFQQFSTLADAQMYAQAQTVLANLPPGDVTAQWSQPLRLADGTYVVQCFYDPDAVAWQSSWNLPSAQIGN